MQHEWMIDVLNDLRAFSYNHKMLKLAEHLDDAILVAASEMAQPGQQQGANRNHVPSAGTINRPSEAG